MAITVEELLALATKVLESRGKRVVEATEAADAEAVAARERSQADAANASEDEVIAAFKTAANDYVKD